jgi:hypothetical protein
MIVNSTVVDPGIASLIGESGQLQHASCLPDPAMHGLGYATSCTHHNSMAWSLTALDTTIMATTMMATAVVPLQPPGMPALLPVPMSCLMQQSASSTCQERQKPCPSYASEVVRKEKCHLHSICKACMHPGTLHSTGDSVTQLVGGLVRFSMDCLGSPVRSPSTHQPWQRVTHRRSAHTSPVVRGYNYI